MSSSLVAKRSAPSRLAPPARQRPDSILWTPAERQAIVVKGLEILADEPTRNLTGVIIAAQKILPESRRRNITTTTAKGCDWFTVPLRAFLASPPEESAVDSVPFEEGGSVTGLDLDAIPNYVQATTAEPSPIGRRLTMEQLMECDPRMLVRALERHCLGRLDTFASMILRLDALLCTNGLPGDGWLEAEETTNHPTESQRNQGMSSLRRLVDSRS